MTARGRTKATYNTDGHTGEPAAFNVRVPDNLYSQATIGWSAPTSGATTHPKNFYPRHVEGVTSGGYRVRAICPDVTADLWTGAATTWTIIDNAGGTDTATVTGYVGEKYTT